MSLIGQQINNSFQGLLKTENNGAIGSVPYKLTDGVGNQTGIQLDPGQNGPAYVETKFQLEGWNTQNLLKNVYLDRTQYPMNPYTSNTKLKYTDTNDQTTYQIAQNQYGSVEYAHVHGGFNNQQHIFQAFDGSGNLTTAKISINQWNSPNNSDNWQMGYIERITAGSFDNGTRDLTLTKPSGTDIVVNIPGGSDTTYDLGSLQNAANVDLKLTGSDATTDIVKIVAGTNITLTDNGSNEVTIDAAGGGGGGATPAMTVASLPPIASRPGVATGARYLSYKGGEYASDYATAGLPVSTNSYWKVFPMAEGEQIGHLYFNIKAAAANASTNAVVGIYELVLASNGQLVMGDLLKDCGAIPANVTGDKFIDISSSPFIMPTGSTYGAVGIIIGNSTAPLPVGDTFQIAGFSDGDTPWVNGTSNIANGTIYRAQQRQYDSWPGNLPSNLNQVTNYDSGTNNPPVILVAR